MSRSFSYPSTSSLVSSTSHASSQPLRPMSSQKDFSAAFGKLQSSYGLSGMPSSSVTPKKPSKLRSLFRPSITSTSSSQSASTPPSRPLTASPSESHPPRDFEAAFASLSGSYGFVGAMPSLPSKSQKGKSQTPSGKSKPRSREPAFGKLSSLQEFAGRAPPMAFR